MDKFSTGLKTWSQHLAVVSVGGIIHLVTWNIRHIARERTRRIVDSINFLLGFPRIYKYTWRFFLSRVKRNDTIRGKREDVEKRL